MSALSQLLKFCVMRGWLELTMLSACDTIARGRLITEWLRPEQVASLQPLVEELLDPYQQFAWRTYLSTGLRAEEVVALLPTDLDRRDGILLCATAKALEVARLARFRFRPAT